MKKIFSLLIVLVFFSFYIISCENEDKQSSIVSDYSTFNLNENHKWCLYYCEWDEWGRASRDCKGWGLCNFYDCWNCNIDNKNGKYQGKVLFDDITREGFLIIELDILDDIQKYAIENNEIFSIDEDINNPNSILHKGQYQFDSTIGLHGGYKINITIK